MIDVGQTIGNYKITAKLGEGGMGVVYLAEHPVIGKKVAMKAIHPELSRNPEVVSRFVTEAKSVNQIGNEHIVDISDFGNTPEGEFYFVMEYLQGESLADRLKRDGQVVPERAISIAVQVADALSASHQHGIIHRDLKPENIYIVRRGVNRDFVKVLDFGLAKLTQVEEKVTHKTRTGSVMGTPYYMSPEQCEGKIGIDHRADVYSLGIILFEMLTGKVPFGGEGYGEIIVKHITHQAPSPRALNPDVSAELELILYRALAKDRDERFGNMAELRAALLDPQGYARSSPPMVGMRDDNSGIHRAASPMARSELNLVFGGVAITTGELTPRPSTFRQSTGEMVEEPSEITLTPKSGRKVVLGVLAGVALAGIAIAVVGGANRRQERKPASAVALTAAVPPARAPATVRVNFTSDPDGASVIRADTGRDLGRTPLSIEVPYSDAAVEFVLQKKGYETKTMFVVPNLPAPLFATLRPVTTPETPPTASPSPARRPAGAVRKPEKLRPAPVDEDAVLEPSFR
jgi:serine/threonine protein kinase